MHVCIVAAEDIAQKILEFIKVSFIKIEIFQYSSQLLKKIREGRKWLIAYIDESLPDMSGQSLASLLQYEFPAMPVILLNGFDKEEFMAELHKTLDEFEKNSILRSQPLPNFRLKNFVFNAKQRIAHKNGEAIKLRKKEAQLLEYFLRYKGKLVTRPTLLEAVWGHKYKHNSHTINTHIAQLRRKIGSDVVQIKNLPGQGFLLTQTIEPSI